MFSFILIAVSNYGYSQVSSLKDEYKKELWKTIKPIDNTPLTVPSEIQESLEDESVTDNKYTRAYSKYKYKATNILDMFEDEYKVSPNLTRYTGSSPVNKLPPGSTDVVFRNGHFDIVPTITVFVVPGGYNFGGWSKKKLSQKSKNILINVFGMEIED